MNESLPTPTTATAESGGSTAEDVAAGFTQVRTKRGYEYIYEQVREAIVSGRFKPGDRLPAERDMAQIFGVSRQGVREAIRGLESTGLVEIRLGVLGGVYVRAGDPRTITRAMSDLASLGAFSPGSLLTTRFWSPSPTRSPRSCTPGSTVPDPSRTRTSAACAGASSDTSAQAMPRPPSPRSPGT
jgi:DNA-binding transcriptional regulator YhcF (GntR family)